MSFSFRRSTRLGRRTRLNWGSGGASVSRRSGPLTVSSRGRVSIRTPIRGLSFRFRLW